jgi:hypothetical protein
VSEELVERRFLEDALRERDEARIVAEDWVARAKSTGWTFNEPTGERIAFSVPWRWRTRKSICKAAGKKTGRQRCPGGGGQGSLSAKPLVRKLAVNAKR